MVWFAWATAWVATASAAAYGIYITHNPNCLWVMFIPAIISISTGKNKIVDDDE